MPEPIEPDLLERARAIDAEFDGALRAPLSGARAALLGLIEGPEGARAMEHLDRTYVEAGQLPRIARLHELLAELLERRVDDRPEERHQLVAYALRALELHPSGAAPETWERARRQSDALGALALSARLRRLRARTLEPLEERRAALEALALEAEAQGCPGEACEAWADALELEPGEQWLLERCGELAAEPEARPPWQRALQTALGAAPWAAEPEVRAGLLVQLAETLEEPAALLEEAAERAPNHPALLRWIEAHASNTAAHGLRLALLKRGLPLLADPQARARRHLQIARIADGGLREPERALQHLQAVLTLGRLAGPCEAEAARLQRELLRRAGRTEALVAALQRDVDALPEGDPQREPLLRERVALHKLHGQHRAEADALLLLLGGAQSDLDDRDDLLLRLALLQQHHLGELEPAVHTWTRLLNLQRRHTEQAYAALDALFAQLGEHRSRVALLERRWQEARDADAAPRTDSLLRLAARMAELAEAPLGDLALAARWRAAQLQLAPAEEGAARALADLLERLQRWGELAEHLKGCAARAPDGPPRARLLRRAGIAALQSGDPADARATLQRAFDADPDDRATLEALAALYRSEGAWEDLFDALDALLDREEGADARRALLDAQVDLCLDHLRDDRRALVALDRRCDEAPEELAPRERRLDLLLILGDAPRALQALGWHLERAGELQRIALLLQIADLQLHQAADPEAARETLLRLLQLDDASRPALLRLLVVYDALGEHRAAAEAHVALARHAEAPAERIDHLTRAAHLLDARCQRPREALALLRSAHDLDPHAGETWDAMQALAAREGLWEPWAAILRDEIDAIAGAPEALDLLLQLADLLLHHLRDPERLQRALFEAADLAPLDPRVTAALDAWAGQHRAWDQRAQHLEALQRAALLRDDLRAAVQLGHQLAEVRADRLGQHEAALRAACGVALLDRRPDAPHHATLARLALTPRGLRLLPTLLLELREQPAEAAALTHLLALACSQHAALAPLYSERWITALLQAASLTAHSLSLYPGTTPPDLIERARETLLLLRRWQELADLLGLIAAAEPRPDEAAALWLQRADLLQRRCRAPASALDALERAVKLRPGDRATFERALEACTQQAAPARAERLIRHALEHARWAHLRHDPAARIHLLALLAEHLRQQGRGDSSAEVLEMVAALDPTHDAVYDHFKRRVKDTASAIAFRQLLEVRLLHTTDTTAAAALTLELARLLVARFEDPTTALDLLESLEGPPRDDTPIPAEARERLLVLARERGDLPRVLRVLERRYAEQPHASDAAVEALEALFHLHHHERGDLRAAAHTLQRIADLRPEDPAVHLRLLATFELLDDPAGVLDALQHLDALARAGRWRCAMHRGRLLNHPRLLRRRAAFLLERLKRPEEAADAFAAWMTLGHDPLRALQEAREALARAGRDDLLLPLYDRALALTPDAHGKADLLADMALLAERRFGRAEQAAELLERAAALQPGRRDLLRALERLARQGGTPEQHLRIVLDALRVEVDPERRRDLHAAATNLHRARGHHAHAALHAQRWLHERPRDRRAFLALARALDDLKDGTRLVSTLRRALAAAPRDAHIERAGLLEHLAEAELLLRHDPAAAVQARRRLALEQPERLDHLQRYADAAARAGRWHAHAEALQRLIPRSEDPYARHDLLLQLAHTAQHHLADPLRACDALRSADETLPRQPDTLRRLCDQLDALHLHEESARRRGELAALVDDPKASRDASQRQIATLEHHLRRPEDAARVALLAWSHARAPLPDLPHLLRLAQRAGPQALEHLLDALGSELQRTLDPHRLRALCAARARLLDRLGRATDAATALLDAWSHRPHDLLLHTLLELGRQRPEAAPWAAAALERRAHDLPEDPDAEDDALRWRERWLEDRPGVAQHLLSLLQHGDPAHHPRRLQRLRALALRAEEPRWWIDGLLLHARRAADPATRAQRRWAALQQLRRVGARPADELPLLRELLLERPRHAPAQAALRRLQTWEPGAVLALLHDLLLHHRGDATTAQHLASCIEHHTASRHPGDAALDAAWIALRAAPHDPDARRRLARLAAHHPQPAEIAAGLVELAEHLPPDRSVDLRLDAARLSHTADLAWTVELLHEARLLAPGHEGVRAMLCDLYQRQERYDALDALHSQAAPDDEPTRPAYALHAAARLANHAPEQAASWLQRALAAEPYDFDAHARRARLLLRAGRLDAAGHALDDALRLGADTPGDELVALLELLAQACEARGDLAAAEARWRAAADARPRRDDLHRRLDHLLTAQRRHPERLHLLQRRAEALDHLRALGCDDPPLRAALERTSRDAALLALDTLDDPATAERALLRWLQRSGEAAAPLQLLAALYERQQRWTPCADALWRRLPLTPDRARRADLLRHLRDVEAQHTRRATRALEAARALAALLPSSAPDWAERGRLEDALGHTDDAIAALTRAVRLGAEGPPRQRLLALLLDADALEDAAPHAEALLAFQPDEPRWRSALMRCAEATDDPRRRLQRLEAARRAAADPEDRAALAFSIGRTWRDDLRDLPPAAAWFARAADDAPHDLRAVAACADLAWRLERWEEAAARCAQAAQLLTLHPHAEQPEPLASAPGRYEGAPLPPHALLRTRLGRALLRLDRPAEALPHLRAAAIAAPAHAIDALLTLGRYAATHGPRVAATRDLQALLDHAADRLLPAELEEVCARLLHLHADEGEDDAALAAAACALDHGLPAPPAALALAQRAAAWTLALRLLDDALQRAPTPAEAARWCVAQARLHEEHRHAPADAADAVERALLLQPDDPELLEHLMRLRLRLGQQEEAVALARQLLRRDDPTRAPRSITLQTPAVEPYTRRLLLCGDALVAAYPGEALALYDRALELRPTWLEPLRRIARATEPPGRLPLWRGRVAFLAQRWSPEELEALMPELLHLLAELRGRGAARHALDLLEQLLQAAPQRPDLHHERFEALAAGPTLDPGAALEALRALIRLGHLPAAALQRAVELVELAGRPHARLPLLELLELGRALEPRHRDTLRVLRASARPLASQHLTPEGWLDLVAPPDLSRPLLALLAFLGEVLPLDQDTPPDPARSLMSRHLGLVNHFAELRRALLLPRADLLLASNPATLVEPRLGRPGSVAVGEPITAGFVTRELTALLAAALEQTRPVWRLPLALHDDALDALWRALTTPGRGLVPPEVRRWQRALLDLPREQRQKLASLQLRLREAHPNPLDLPPPPTWRRAALHAARLAALLLSTQASAAARAALLLDGHTAPPQRWDDLASALPSSPRLAELLDLLLSPEGHRALEHAAR